MTHVDGPCIPLDFLPITDDYRHDDNVANVGLGPANCTATRIVCHSCDTMCNMRHRDAPIVLFTIYGCPYCQNSVRFLKRNNIPHKAINIGNNAKMMTDLAESTGWPTVPKVFVQGKFIGGYNELMHMAESGELQNRLAQPMA